MSTDEVAGRSLNVVDREILPTKTIGAEQKRCGRSHVVAMEYALQPPRTTERRFSNNPGAERSFSNATFNVQPSCAARRRRRSVSDEHAHRCAARRLDRRG